MNNTVISPVYPMLIQKYNTLIPDPNANVLDKINTIIDYLNQTGKLTNDVVDNWNKVMAWAMNDGLTADVGNKLETMLSSGEFDTLFQKYITPSLGDITLLQTVDKTSVVNAVNEVDNLAKTNQTNLGNLSNLTTSDKTSLVNAVNSNVASLADIATVNNHTITYGYDASGNVQTITEKDSSNNTIKTVTYTYDSTTGNITQSVTVMNGKTVSTTYNYDASGNITSTSNVIS